MKTLITIMICTALVSCHSSEKISDGIRVIVGKPISYAVDSLGFPDSESDISGQKGYTWILQQDIALYMMDSQLDLTTTIADHHCKLNIFVDENDIITKFRWNGHMDVCSLFADRL